VYLFLHLLVVTLEDILEFRTTMALMIQSKLRIHYPWL